jgi:hypothetical protein
MSLAMNNFSSCAPLLKGTIKIGAQNDAAQVNKLITFLNTNEGESLLIDGSYDRDDVLAVKRFQTKYKKDILAPLGISQATGIVSIATRGKINGMHCVKTGGCINFTTDRKNGDKGDDILSIKSFLTLFLGVSLDTKSNIFDGATDAAVRQYQSTYKETILKPLGLKNATGFWGKSTRSSATGIIGCAN